MKDRGYLPHNGHGYVAVPQQEIERDPVITDLYSFVYHEHVYGYPDFDLLGFGTNAVSSFQEFSIFNTSSRSVYIDALNRDELPLAVKHHDPAIDACRPVALALPYHGSVKKKSISWELIPEGISDRLQALIESGLITETDSTYDLTREGWEWYSCIMYFLMPPRERIMLDAIVRKARRDEKRDIEPTGLEGLTQLNRISA